MKNQISHQLGVEYVGYIFISSKFVKTTAAGIPYIVIATSKHQKFN